MSDEDKKLCAEGYGPSPSKPAPKIGNGAKIYMDGKLLGNITDLKASPDDEIVSEHFKPFLGMSPVSSAAKWVEAEQQMKEAIARSFWMGAMPQRDPTAFDALVATVDGLPKLLKYWGEVIQLRPLLIQRSATPWPSEVPENEPVLMQVAMVRGMVVYAEQRTELGCDFKAWMLAQSGKRVLLVRDDGRMERVG